MLARDGAGALGSGRGDPGARGSDARASAHLTSLFKIKILQRFYGKTLATVALSGLMEIFVVSKDERTRRLPTAAFGRRPSGPGLRSGATGPALRPEPRRAPSTLRWSRCSRRFPAGLGCPASQIGAGSSVPAPNRPLPQQRPRRLSSRSDVRCPSTKHGCLSHFYIVPKLENSSQNERQPERERRRSCLPGGGSLGGTWSPKHDTNTQIPCRLDPHPRASGFGGQPASPGRWRRRHLELRGSLSGRRCRELSPEPAPALPSLGGRSRCLPGLGQAQGSTRGPIPQARTCRRRSP